MPVLNAMATGFLRTLGLPGMLLGLWLVNVMVALPAVWLVTPALEESIGASLAAEELRTGFDMGWYGEFSETARGIERTFRPAVTGVTAFYDNLEAWLTGNLFSEFSELVGVGLAYALIWALLLGGVLQRFAVPDRTGLRSFVRSGGTFFVRFLRLALISAPLYWLVYRLYRWLGDRLDVLTRDVTEEVTILLLSLGVWILTALLLTLIHMSFGYAKIATVLEDRRSMFVAAVHGIAFVLRHPLKTCGLYYGMLLIAVILLGLCAWLSPGAGASTWVAVLFTFVAGQLYIFARLSWRVALLGAQMELYRRLRG